MAGRTQMNWRELCVAVTNEKDPTTLSSLVRQLIEALDKGERSWRRTVPPSDAIDTHQDAASERANEVLCG